MTNIPVDIKTMLVSSVVTAITITLVFFGYLKMEQYKQEDKTRKRAEHIMTAELKRLNCLPGKAVHVTLTQDDNGLHLSRSCNMAVVSKQKR